MQEYLRAWVHLSSIVGFGPVTIQKILTKFSQPELFLALDSSSLHAFGCTPKQIKQITNKPTKLFTIVDQWCAGEFNNLICFYDKEYPELLQQIAGAPPLLYIHGNMHAIKQQQIAIVGSRNPSHYGRRIAYDVAMQLATNRLGVCSGLALGIDSCAHQGAIDVAGNTIAVMGCGLNQIYPARNKQLAADIIAAGGAIISEFPPHIKPCATNFPRRNRLVSGLSLGVVVIEAALKSGSLITANYAADQGRAVMAFPGSIYNALSFGCHQLLREGAVLVRDVHDIFSELKLEIFISKQYFVNINIKNNSHDFLDKDCAQVLYALECADLGVDAIVQLTGISAKQAMICLHKLKLAGKVIESFGVYQKK
jgi:DNA processing protein